MTPRERASRASAIREAKKQDADRITALINQAYLPAEGFLYEGPRISADEVRGKLENGTFLLHATAIGSLEGCVYVAVRGSTGYFGLLSVATDRQHHGIGRKLVAAAELFCRTRACEAVEIDVVNHRQELFPFYGGLGYHVIGERPFEDSRLNRPCHFVMMRKTLSNAGD